MKNKSLMDLKSVTPEQAIEFIEGMRQIIAGKDEKTVLVSIRIPANILRAVKNRAKMDGKKYQSLIIEMLRKSLT